MELSKDIFIYIFEAKYIYGQLSRSLSLPIQSS